MTKEDIIKERINIIKDNEEKERYISLRRIRKEEIKREYGEKFDEYIIYGVYDNYDELIFLGKTKDLKRKILSHRESIIKDMNNNYYKLLSINNKNEKDKLNKFIIENGGLDNFKFKEIKKIIGKYKDVKNILLEMIVKQSPKCNISLFDKWGCVVSFKWTD